MHSIKIISSIFLIYLSSVRCSVAPAVGVAQPGIAYTRVAPPSTIPFAASVNTFTRGLNVFAAPYAAGVAPYPYYTNSLYPSAQIYPSVYSPNFVPAGVAPAPAVITPNSAVPSNLYPYSFRVSPNFLTRAAPVPAYPGSFVPASAPAGVVPSSLLPSPFGVEGRSVHAVGPSVPVAPTLG